MDLSTLSTEGHVKPIWNPKKNMLLGTFFLFAEISKSIHFGCKTIVDRHVGCAPRLVSSYVTDSSFQVIHSVIIKEVDIEYLFFFFFCFCLEVIDAMQQSCSGASLTRASIRDGMMTHCH